MSKRHPTYVHYTLYESGFNEKGGSYPTVVYPKCYVRRFDRISEEAVQLENLS